MHEPTLMIKNPSGDRRPPPGPGVESPSHATLAQRDDCHHDCDLIDFELTDWKVKFHKILSALPDDLRRVCVEIVKGKEHRAVARDLGISLEALERLLDELQKQFEALYEGLLPG